MSTRSACWSVLCGVLLWGGCGETVSIRLEPGSCGDPSTLFNINSALVRLERDDGLTYDSGCKDEPSNPHSVAGLEDFLGESVPAFRNVPKGGSWTIWIVGYDTASCSGPIQLCGCERAVRLPPPEDVITVTVNCASRVTSEEEQAKLNQCKEAAR